MKDRFRGRGTGRRAAVALALVVAAIAPAAGRANPLAPPECGAEGKGRAPSSKRTLRVGSYNVLHGLTESPETRYPAHSTLDQRLVIAARQLAEDGVDVAGLQEVSKTVDVDRHHRNGQVARRLARELARLTRSTWYWCWYQSNPHQAGEPDVQPGGGGPLSERNAGRIPGPYNGTEAGKEGAQFREGPAIISRYPFLETEGRRLPSRLPIEHATCISDHQDELSDPEAFAGGQLGCQLTIPFESRAVIWANVDTPEGPTSIASTHLAHEISSASDYSALEQAAVALAFEAERAAAAANPPARRFLVCDCNSRDVNDTPSDEVPVIPMIKDAGWIDTYRALNTDPGYTGGPDTIVTPAPRRSKRESFHERIDYVFWRPGSCQRLPIASRIIADRPVLQATGRWAGMWLWPSDHLGLATDVPVAGCA